MPSPHLLYKVDLQNKDVRLFMDIQKFNKDEQTVEGYASTPGRDSQDDIIPLEAIADALPGYLVWGNIREQHNPLSAVGKVLDAHVDEYGLFIKAKIVDPIAWLKVKERVYKGFSIGGKVLKFFDKDGTRVITKLNLYEISIVDRPANEECAITDFKSYNNKGATAMPSKVKAAPVGEAAIPVPTEVEVVEKTESLADRVVGIIRKDDGSVDAEADDNMPGTPEEDRDDDVEGSLDDILDDIMIHLVSAIKNGDSTNAQMLMQAVALIQEALNPKDAGEDAPAMGDESTPSDMSAMHMSAAVKSSLTKAGKPLNANNATTIRTAVQSLLQMLAATGDDSSNRALACFSDGDTALGGGVNADKTIGVNFIKASMLTDEVTKAVGDVKAEFTTALEAVAGELSKANSTVARLEARLTILDSRIGRMPAAGGVPMRGPSQAVGVNSPSRVVEIPESLTSKAANAPTEAQIRARALNEEYQSCRDITKRNELAMRLADLYVEINRSKNS